MKPEFEQLLKGLGIIFHQDGTLETLYLDKLLFQELMEDVWNMAIEEASTKAETFYDGDTISNAIKELKIW